jgi:hypothetical protein
VVLAGNAISSVSQARSAATAVVATPTTTPTTPTASGGGGGGGGGGTSTGSTGATPTTTVPADPPAASDPPARSTATVPSRTTLRVTLVRVKGATTVSWKLNAAAKVTVRFDQVTTGRRVLGTCKPTTRSTRNRPTCRRSVTIGSVTQSARAGAGHLKVPRKIGKRTLVAGRYRVTVTALGTDGQRVVGRVANLVVKGA